MESQPTRELLLVDGLEGPPLDAGQWRVLVDEVGPRLGALCIVHVEPRGLDAVEYCVLMAMGSGLKTQVFCDRKQASLWLSYGEDATGS